MYTAHNSITGFLRVKSGGEKRPFLPKPKKRAGGAKYLLPPPLKKNYRNVGNFLENYLQADLPFPNYLKMLKNIIKKIVIG